MKIAFKNTIMVCLMAIALFFTACQQDQSEPNLEILQTETNNLDAEIIALMIQMASNDGSFDNIIDGASCLEINFPYRIKINTIEYEIKSEEDFELIEAEFDALEDDDDVLSFIFPINITTADHTKIIIDDLEALNKLIEACVEGGLDDDIECIDVLYPVTFFTFNLTQEQTNSIVVSDDSELQRFLAGLGAEDVVSIDYPVLFELYDDSKITANSLAELQAAIIEVVNACDEDDDSNYNDDDFTEEGLKDILNNCSWYIETVVQNEVSATESYDNVVMNFTDDGKLTVENLSGESFLGLWGTNNSTDGSIIDLQLDELDDFNGRWFVYEINPFKIKFTNASGDKIILNSSCNPDFELCDSDYIIETLSSCRWMIVNDSGSFFEDLSIDFSNMNIHAYSQNGDAQDQGSWRIEENVLILNNLSMALANFTGGWTIEECRSDRLQLTGYSGEVLVLEKKCD